MGNRSESDRLRKKMLEVALVHDVFSPSVSLVRLLDDLIRLVESRDGDSDEIDRVEDAAVFLEKELLPALTSLVNVLKPKEVESFDELVSSLRIKCEDKVIQLLEKVRAILGFHQNADISLEENKVRRKLRANSKKIQNMMDVLTRSLSGDHQPKKLSLIHI